MHPINHEWDEYYQALESIRESGVCNMWGANPVLATCCNISQELAKQVLLSWISNYTELKIYFGW